MNVKNTHRRTILTWALILILALTVFPVTSFADEADTNEATDAALETEENAEEPDPEVAVEEEIVTSEVVFALNQTIYTVDGTNYAMDVAPYIQDSRIMVPVAHVSRALGAEVHWDPGTRTVTVTSGDDVITMVIGSATLLKNGLFFDEMDTVAVIKDIGGGLGRTMIPVSRLARALDVAYTWDPVTRSAVFMPGTVVIPVDPTIEPIVFAEAGTFGPPTRPGTINNDVVVSAEDVTLRNYVITGDLIIAEEVGEGSVTLNNMTVQGTTYVRGGGMDSIYIDGGIYNEIIIEKDGGNVRIVYTNAEGGHVIITEAVNGAALDRTEIILEGNFEKITVLASYIDISFKGKTTVGEIIVEEEAESVTLNLSEETEFNRLTSHSVNLKVDGHGIVRRDGGDERRSIKYADTVTKPVAPSPGGGGPGPSTPPAPTPTLDEKVLAATREAADLTTMDIKSEVIDNKKVISATIKDGQENVNLQDAYDIKDIFDALKSQKLTIAKVTVPFAQDDFVIGTRFAFPDDFVVESPTESNVLENYINIRQAIVDLVNIHSFNGVYASYSELTLGSLAGKYIIVEIGATPYYFVVYDSVMDR
ncbi:MAG: stalk domain-containing protein [Bacillota bacterium]|nr:stalk domain-containing protein [Bacillota bacterium]MDW7676560.1 stalk domain-containing protein [Bacillota bacterium]